MHSDLDEVRVTAGINRFAGLSCGAALFKVGTQGVTAAKRYSVYCTKDQWQLAEWCRSATIRLRLPPRLLSMVDSVDNVDQGRLIH